MPQVQLWTIMPLLGDKMASSMFAPLSPNSSLLSHAQACKQHSTICKCAPKAIGDQMHHYSLNSPEPPALTLILLFSSSRHPPCSPQFHQWNLCNENSTPPLLSLQVLHSGLPKPRAVCRCWRAHVPPSAWPVFSICPYCKSKALALSSVTSHRAESKHPAC